MEDITIIGGGPVGMFTAFYGGMRQAKVKIIESLPQLGGQLAALYPEKYIYDIAGFPKIRAQELVNQLNVQMQQFDPIICLNESVLQITKKVDGTFEIETNKGRHKTKSIIITAGNGAFKPRRLELENGAQFEDTNLHYFVQDMSQFQNKRVAILGGGDSAIDWALMLEPIAKQVTLIHRRDKFRAHERSVSLLQHSKVEVCTPYIPIELQGGERIEQIRLQHTKTKEERLLDIDELIVNYGFVSSLGVISQWGLQIEQNVIVVDSTQQTNIAGIFAAGDICTYDGKVKLIVAGFGEGPAAVNAAKRYYNPEGDALPLHSTSIFSQTQSIAVTNT